VVVQVQSRINGNLLFQVAGHGQCNQEQVHNSTFTPPSTLAGTTYYRVLSMQQIMDAIQAVSNNAVAVISADLLVTTQPTMSMSVLVNKYNDSCG
jgi:hypothetical protein